MESRIGFRNGSNVNPATDSATKRGLFDGLLLPIRAIRIRLALAKKRASARLRINKANNQSMLVDLWPTLRPHHSQSPYKLGPTLPLYRVVSIPSNGDQIRPIGSDMTLRDEPNTLSNIHPPPPLPYESQTRHHRIIRRLRRATMRPSTRLSLRGPPPPSTVLTPLPHQGRRKPR